MVSAIGALVLAASAPVFSASEIRSFPCGWTRTTTDTPRGDSVSTAAISDDRLTVNFSGADESRTVFLTVAGVELRVTGSGPIAVERRVPRHRMLKIVFGTLHNGGVVYATARCLPSR